MPLTGAADGWQLAGSSPDAYERYLVPRLFRPWADRLIDVVGLGPGARVVDVGCGTGIIPRRAATGFREVAIRLEVGTVRYPSTEEFVRYEAASSPLAGPIGAMSDDARTALLDELDAALRPYMDDDGILSPMVLYIVTALR